MLEQLEDRTLLATNIVVQTGGTATLADVANFAPAGDFTIDPNTISAATSTVSLRATHSVTFVDVVAIFNAGVGLDVYAQSGTNNADFINVNANLFLFNNADLRFFADDGVHLAANVHVGLSGGDYVANADTDFGPNGAYIQDSGSQVTTSGGSVTILTGRDDPSPSDVGGVVLNGTINSGSGAMLLSPIDTAQTIGIGTGVSSEFFRIDQDELNRLTSSSTVTIGQIGTSGTVNFTDLDISSRGYSLQVWGGNINLHHVVLGTNTSLQLLSQGAIIDAGGADPNIQISGSASSALLDSRNGVGTADAIEIQVANVAARASVAGDVRLISLNGGTTTVGSVGGVNGISAPSGSVIFTAASMAFTAAGDVTAGSVIDLSASGTVTMADGTVFTAGSGVSVVSAFSVVLGRITTTSGSVFVQAGPAGIFDNTAAEGAGNENIVAPSATLIAQGGIGSAGGSADIDTAVGTLTVTNTGSGNVFIDDTDSVSVSGSNTGGGSFNITAGGAGNTLTVTASNVTAGSGSVTLQADEMVLTGTVTGNGGVTLRPNTAGTTVTLGNGSAGLNLTDATLDKVFTTTTLTIGSASAPAAGTIIVDAAITPANAPNLTLASGSNITFGPAGSVTVTGTVTLTCTGTVNGDPAALVNVTANTLVLNAGSGAGSATTPLETSVAVLVGNSGSGDIFITEANLLTVGPLNTTSGDINVTAGGALNTGGPISTTGGDVQLVTTAGNITINNDISTGGGAVILTAAGSVVLGRIVNPTGPVTVTAVAGNITDTTAAEGPGGENIVGDVVTLNAATGVGATGATADIDVDANTLASTSATGGIFITETNTVTLGATTTTTSGNIVIAATSTLTVVGPVSAAGAGSVTLTANALAINGSVSSATGNLSLTGATGVTNNASGRLTTGGAGTISVTATANALTMGDGTVYTAATGAVTLQAATDVALGRVVTTSGTITVTAGGGNILDNTAGEGAGSENIVTTLAGGNVTLNAPAGNVGSAAPGGNIDIAVAGTFSSTSGAFGNANDGTYLSIIGPFSLSGINSARNIDVTATGAITINSAVTANHDGSIRLASTGAGITVNNTVTATGAGNVTLDAAQLLAVNAVVSSTSGNLTLIGGTGVTHSAAGDLTTGGAGTITVTSTANNITMADGTVYTAGGGTVSLNAANNVLLGRVNNSTGAVNVTATAGNVTDNTAGEGAGNENVVGSNVSFAAATGVGATGAAPDIDTAAATLSAVSNTGGIFINETDAVSLATLTTTTSGNIEIIAGGAITTTGAISTAGGGNIHLVATTGGLTVKGSPTASTINSGTGTATLEAQGSGQLLTIETNGTVSGSGGVSLIADNMAIDGTITATGATAQLCAFSPNADLNIGSADQVAPPILGLTLTELSHISAAVIKLCAGANGNILISVPLFLPGTTLSLQAGGTISQSAGAIITLAGLALRSGGPITLNEANNVTTLAANISGLGNTFQFTNGLLLNVGTVDGLNGVSTNNGPITIVTLGGGLTIKGTPAANDVNAGNSTVLLEARGIDQLLTLEANSNVNGLAGVTLLSDRMALDGTVTSNLITVRQQTNGQLINIGGSDGAGMLGLTAVEMNNLQAGVNGLVRIGNVNSGHLTVTAPVALPIAVTRTLSLQTGGSLTEAGGSLAVQNLALHSGDMIDCTQGNDVLFLAARADGAGKVLKFTDINGMDIGLIDGVAGATSNNGEITLTTVTGVLRVTDTGVAGSEVNAGTAKVNLTAGSTNQSLMIRPNADVAGLNGVNLVADVMDLDGTVTAPGVTVTIRQVTNGQVIALGGTDSPPGTLGLTTAELNHITAGLLRIGDGSSGNTILIGPIAPAGTNILSLQTGGTITQAAGATITETTLALRAAGAITLTEANDAGTLAATATSGDLQYTDANAVAIGTVDLLTGVTATNGGVTLIAGGTLGATLVTAGGALHNVLLKTTAGNIVAGTITSPNVATLIAAGAIVAATGSAVTAPSLVMTAATGIGSAANPLGTTVSIVRASGGSGGVFVTNTVGLVLGTISATGGDIAIVATGGPLTVVENVTTPGAIRLTAIERDPPGPGDDLTINPGVVVQSAASTVALRAGDLVTVQAGATVQSAGAMTIATGFTDNDGIGGATLLGAILGNAATVLGGPGNETFVINPTSTNAMLIDGQGGSDTYLISFGALGGAVSVSDSGTGTDTLTVLGTAAAQTLVVTATAVVWNGTQVINYAGVESLTVRGGAGNDVLIVSSSAATTPVTLDGLGGDDSYQVFAGSLAGLVTVSDSSGGNDQLAILGTAAADAFTVTVAAVLWNGAQQVAYSGIEALRVSAGDSNDSLSVSSTSPTGVTLDGQGGSDAYTVSFGALPGPVVVSDSGGAGTDSLIVLGTTGGDTLTVAATAVVWNNVQAVTYAGLEALVVNGGDGNDLFQAVSSAATTPVALDGQGGDDTYQLFFGALAGTLIVSDSGSGGNDQVVIFGTTAADVLTATATATVWNGVQVVNYAGIEGLAINGGDGNDVFLVSSTSSIGLTLDGQGGSDTYTVSFGALVGAVTVSDSGSAGSDSVTTLGTAVADVLAVSATAVLWNNAQTVNYAGVEALAVNGGDGGDVFVVSSTSATGARLDGQGDSDTYTVSFGAIVGPVTVSDSGGPGADTLTLLGTASADALTVASTAVAWNGAQTVAYAGVEALFVNGDSGDDTLTVVSTAAVGVNLDGQAGDDTYTVFFGAIAGPVIVSDSGSGGSDKLTTTGTAAGQTLTVTATSVVSNGAEVVAYAGIEALTVNGGDGGDTLQVLSTSAATPVTVNGQGGDDRIMVSSDPSGNGVLNGLAGPLTIDGGVGSNALTVSESALGKSDIVFVNSTQIIAVSVPFPILYQATGGTFGGGVTVVGPAVASTLVVVGTLAGGPTTVRGGAGADNVLLTATGSLADGKLSGLAGPLTVDAGGGANILYVSDAGNTTAETLTLTATTLTSSVTSVNVTYQATGGSYAGVTLFTGSASDTMNVQGTAPGSVTSVNTNDGDDQITVSSSSGQLDTFGGPLIVEAGAGTNHLTISEAGRVAPDHVVVQSTVISSPVVGFGIIYQATGGTFGGGVDFDAGQGNDIVEVVSQLSKSPLTIFGDGGDDTFNVAVTPSSSYSQFTLDGGPGTDTLNVVDQTNTAVMQQFPSGPGAGSIRVAYLGGSVSALSYRNMEGVKNSVDPNSSYIQALYHVELAANAGPGDFAFWSDVLQAEGRQAVAQGIHDSGAARTHRVLGWYSQYLNFVPKDGGEQFWVNLLASQSEEAVLSAFLGSQAYFDKSGDNGEGFIRTIYKDLLNRDPGTNELQLWLQTLLPRSGRPGVALLILTSPEYRTNTINAFYTNLLHHSASDAALNFWVNNALSLSQIQVMIEASDEFFAVGG